MLVLRRLNNKSLLENLCFTCSYVSNYSRIIREMHKAYLHYEDGSETFQLCIKVKDTSLGLDRQFNFKRQVTESIGTLLNRINTNLGKIYEKKRKKKKKQENDATSEVANVISIGFFNEGSPVSQDKICKDVLFENCKITLVICNTEYDVILNAPWINSLSLPSSIMAGFPVYPSKLESMFMERNQSLFMWFRKNTDKKEDWSKVGDSYYYTPTSEDIGNLLKLSCTPRNNHIQGPPFDAESKLPVQAGPGFCPFETRHFFTQERVNWPRFRIVSYNILADLYADSDVARNQLYPYCPAYALSIEYRKQLICKELSGYNADIICLQEVDQKVFLSDLNPFLECMDYKSVFTKKGGQVTEGLACFFHGSKFRLVSSHTVCLAEELSESPIFMNLWEKLKDNVNFITRFKDRTTCLLVTILQSVSNPTEIFIIGNTHLYFHPDADHIRLLQAGMIMQYLEQLRTDLSSTMPNSHVSLIMCGDFNSTPDCGVYQLMTTKWVPDDYKDWKSNEVEAIKNVALSHTFLLESACGTPVYTNFTVGFVGCLDYIFYQCDRMAVSQVIPLPLDEDVKEHTALPSVVFPSDHIALVSDLTLEQR